MRAIKLPVLPDADNLYGDIVQWIEDNVTPSTESLVVGVSGGIDSAVVASLCDGTVFPVHLYSLPSALNSPKDFRLAGDEIVKSTQIIVEWNTVNAGWVLLRRRPKFAGRLEAVMDVLSRHARARRKAELVRPEVPPIHLEYR